MTDRLFGKQSERLTEWQNEWMTSWKEKQTDKGREKTMVKKKLESKTRGKEVNEWKRKLSKEVTMQVVKWAAINKIYVIKILIPKVMKKS